VDKALVLENRRRIMEQKRKMQRTGSQGSNTRFRVGSSSRGPVFRPCMHTNSNRVREGDRRRRAERWQAGERRLGRRWKTTPVGRAGPNGRILGPARKNSEKNKWAAREFWAGLISGCAEKKKKNFGFLIQGMIFKFIFLNISKPNLN
jgi:hypothetical protein